MKQLQIQTVCNREGKLVDKVERFATFINEQQPEGKCKFPLVDFIVRYLETKPEEIQADVIFYHKEFNFEFENDKYLLHNVMTLRKENEGEVQLIITEELNPEIEIGDVGYYIRIAPSLIGLGLGPEDEFPNYWKKKFANK